MIPDGFFGNLSPLYIINMAKVSVKWSQNMIFVDRNPLFVQTPDFENALQTAIFDIFGCARKSCSETTLQSILLPYYYCKVVSD